MDKAFCQGIPTNCFEVKMESQAFTVVGSRCRRKRHFVSFALWFSRKRQGKLLTCVLDAQHDYLI